MIWAENISMKHQNMPITWESPNNLQKLQRSSDSLDTNWNHFDYLPMGWNKNKLKKVTWYRQFTISMIQIRTNEHDAQISAHFIYYYIQFSISFVNTAIELMKKRMTQQECSYYKCCNHNTLFFTSKVYIYIDIYIQTPSLMRIFKSSWGKCRPYFTSFRRPIVTTYNLVDPGP